MLKTACSARMEQQVGRYYLLDAKINGIIGKDIDLEDLARKLGVLEWWEALGSPAG